MHTVTTPPPPGHRPTGALNRLIRRAIAWAVFYGVLAALIIASDQIPNIIHLAL